MSKRVVRWFKCEYFYSWIDKCYFLKNDLKTALESIGLNYVSFKLKIPIEPNKTVPRGVEHHKEAIWEAEALFRRFSRGRERKTVQLQGGVQRNHQINAGKQRPTDILAKELCVRP